MYQYLKNFSQYLRVTDLSCGGFPGEEMNFKTPFVRSALPKVTLKGPRDGVTGKTLDGLLVMILGDSTGVTLEAVTGGAILSTLFAVVLGK